MLTTLKSLTENRDTDDLHGRRPAARRRGATAVGSAAVVAVAALAVMLEPGAASASSRSTTVRVVISACPAGCTVTASNSFSQQRLDTAVVRRGRAVLRVPTAATRGLYFIVSDRAGDQGGEGEVGVSLRYLPDRVGHRVSGAEASTATRSQICWSGTTRSDVTFRFRAARFVETGERPGTSLRVWSLRTVRSIGEVQHDDRGAVGIQDTAPCGFA